MGVPHDHLKRPVPEQLCNGMQIDPGHNKSTGKGMAVAMPGVAIDLRLIERCRKPAARPLKCIAASGRWKNRIGRLRFARAAKPVEGGQSDRVQSNSARISVLGLRKMNRMPPSKYTVD